MSGTFFYAAGAADAYGFVEGAEDPRYRQDTGWTRGRTFRGPKENLSGFLTTVHPAVTEITITYEGPVAVVAILYASNSGTNDEDIGSITAKDPILDAWSIGGNIHNLPLLTHPKYSSVEPTIRNPYSLGQMAVGELLYILRIYRKRMADSEEYGGVEDLETFTNANVLAIPGQDPYFAGAFGDTSADRLWRRRWLFKELALERDEWEFAQPVIRKVTVLRSNSATQASFASTGRAYSWPSLKAAEPTLDTALVIGIDTLETMNGDDSWVWQKRFPSVDISSDGKRVLTQEYWGWQAFDEVRYGLIL